MTYPEPTPVTPAVYAIEYLSIRSVSDYAIEFRGELAASDDMQKLVDRRARRAAMSDNLGRTAFLTTDAEGLLAWLDEELA